MAGTIWMWKTERLLRRGGYVVAGFNEPIVLLHEIRTLSSRSS